MCNRFFLILFCLSGIYSILSGSEHGQQRVVPGSDVTLLESTAAGITIEYTPQYRDDIKIIEGEREYRRPVFERSSIAEYCDAGKPDLRFRSVPLLVPGRRQNSITVIAADYETIQGYPLAPVPSRTRAHGEEISREHFVLVDGIHAGFTPIELAVLGIVGEVKGVYTSSVNLFPIQFDPVSKTLRKYSRILIRVNYGERDQIRSSSVELEWARTFINYTEGLRWIPAVTLLKKGVQYNSLLSTGTWYKLEVKEDGMYKIDASYLRSLGIDLSSIGSIRSIRIFSGNGRTLPAELNASCLSDLAEVAVEYRTDTLLFYGKAAAGWDYSADSKLFYHYTNPYSNSNYYFLQVATAGANGKPMQVTSLNLQPDIRTDQTTGKVYFEEDKVNLVQSGLKWVSAQLSPGDSRVVMNKLNGIVAGTPISYRYQFLSRSDVDAVFTVDETGNEIIRREISYMSNMDPVEVPYAVEEGGRVVWTPTLTDDRSNLKISYNVNSKIALGWIDWIEILYKQKLIPVNNSLLFTSPDTTGTVEYTLTQFYNSAPSEMSVYDVTDPLSVKKFSLKPDPVNGTFTLLDTVSRVRMKTYWAGLTAAFKLPSTNLRGMTPGAQFVIITHKDFISEAIKLKNQKENLPGTEKLSTAVIDIDTIYNEFGFGVADPVAIRNFIRYTVNNWAPAPKYILLIGNGNYDYKKILGNDQVWVPTFETQYSLSQVSSYNYDEFFVMLDSLNESIMSLPIGRLPARNLTDARLMIDRIIKYENAPRHGPWKNTITIVADDNYIHEDTDPAPNQEQAEALARSHTPPMYEIKKIYIMDYPTVYSSSGRGKPDARQAIIDQVNRGTLILNYTGHGNPKVWAHESILTQEDVRTLFTNVDYPTFVVAATCDWGRFDEAGEQSSAEDMMMNTRGGAIGVFSATRPVYSNDNALTNYALYDVLLPTNSFTLSPRLGDAMVIAKNDSRVTANIENKRKYHLLGDPTLRLAIPRMVIMIDSINGKPVTSVSVDTLSPLSKVRISASVQTQGKLVIDSVQAVAAVAVFDADRSRTVIDNGSSYTFSLPGPVIYKGDNSIRNGRMQASFIIPKDISYENKNGRVAVYFSNAVTDGRGFTDRIIIGGTSSVSGTDAEGPSIAIFLGSEAFRSGDVTNENPLLIVQMRDSSGINAAGAGIGHRIETWIDDNPKSTDLTDHYSSKIDNFMEGEVRYQFAGLPPGRHSLKVRGWDVYNNSTTATVDFYVSSGASLTITNIYALPNPARNGTAFTFQLNHIEPVDIRIKIYTLGGRLIKTLTTSGVEGPFVRVPWDCRDEDGDQIGNGTYLYKVLARTVDGKFSSEATGKLSILR
jgi:hypothetical protein